MVRRLRIADLLVAFAAFAAGVGFASLFLPGLSASPIEERTRTFGSNSRGCAVVDRSHTERDRAIEDAIRTTELKLIEVKKRTSIHSPRAEKFQMDLQRELEERLKLLLDERNNLLSEKFRELEEETIGSGTKLVYREVCYED